MKNDILAKWTCASAIAIIIAATPAVAQNTADSITDSNPQEVGVPDIIVTAQKREQRLQDVPIAISALSSAALVANRITTVRDLDSVTPNLTVRQIVGGSGLPTYSMRGVVSVGSSLGADRGIALYVDGVYLGNAQGSVFELGDIQRIEVLRGPQGTLFGRNSTGGAISVSTADPKGELGVRETLSLGNYDQFRSVTHVDTPSFGPLSASFNFVHSERRGDIRNLGAGTNWDFTSVGAGRYTSPKYLGGNNIEAGSATVLLDADPFRAIYRFDKSQSAQTSSGQGIIYASPFVQKLFAAQPNQALLTPVSLTRPDAVNNAGVVPSTIKTLGHSLTMTYQISDQLSVKNIAAYRKSSFLGPIQQIDGAGGLINPGPAAVPALALLLGARAATTIGAPYFIQATPVSGGDKQWSDELQFNYQSELVTLTAGALYFRQKSLRGGIGDIGLAEVKSAANQVFPNFVIPFASQPTGYGGRESNVTVISKALFGQAEVHVLDKVDLIGGIRYTNDRKRGTDNTIYSAALPSSFPVIYDNSKVTYNVGINFKPTDKVLLYAKYVTGFISGGFFATQQYNPEVAKSYEAGIKADWFDHRLRTNLSAFSVDYSDLQLTTTGSNLGLNASLTQVIVNAGSARARGFELETTFVPIRPITLNAALGYTDFKYQSLDPRVTANASLFQVHERPKWTSIVSAQYQSEPIFNDVVLVARIDGNWKSGHNAVASVPLATGANLALFGITTAELQRFNDAQKVGAYWLWNGRIALQGFKVGEAKSTVALWGRNLFQNRSVSYAPSLVSLISADYERARTFGLDLTVEF
jgi:iron complex outermembrane receptor protein